MFEERMILYVYHEFPDSYQRGHIVLQIHPDYISRFRHAVNSDRLGRIGRLTGNRYKLIVSEFHSFQGVLAWISNLEGSPDLIPEPYYPSPEPFFVGSFTTFDRRMETTRLIFWIIIAGTVLIVAVGNWLY